MRRLKTTELAKWRDERMAATGGKCELCKLPVKAPCADHDHATGAMRGTICRGCNSVLGKIENSYRKYGVQNLSAFLHGAASYLQRHSTNVTGLLHPSHKSEDEKRERRNLLARKRRAATKG